MFANIKRYSNYRWHQFFSRHFYLLNFSIKKPKKTQLVMVTLLFSFSNSRQNRRHIVRSIGTRDRDRSQQHTLGRLRYLEGKCDRWLLFNQNSTFLREVTNVSCVFITLFSVNITKIKVFRCSRDFSYFELFNPYIFAEWFIINWHLGSFGYISVTRTI